MTDTPLYILASALRPCKLCIIGNSFAGSVYRAYQLQSDEFRNRIRIDFHAAGGVNFKNIAVAEGRVVNARSIAVKHGNVIADYDAVIVYGPLPNPEEVAAMRWYMYKIGISSQVSDAAVMDSITASESYRLCRMLEPSGRSNILALSRNPRSNGDAVNPRRFSAAVRDIALGLGSIRYIPFPSFLFGPDYVPKFEYYKDSVRIDGSSGQSPTQAKQDIYHMNALGGGLVLGGILLALALAPELFT